MHKLFKGLLVTGLILAMSTMLAGCGGGSSNSSSSSSSGSDRVLYERALGDVPTFDPFATSDVTTQRAHYQIFESLFYVTKDGKYEPAICSKYEINKAGDQITFTIRDGVKFHNGATVTPEDVAFSLNTAIKSKYTTKVTSAMKSATVKDGKVVLTLKYPFKPIIGCLTSSNTAIVPKAVYEKDPKAFASKPIGTGPYKLDSVKKGETFTFIAFKDYWRGEAKIKKVVDKVIKDDTSALMAIESGDLQLMQPAQDYSDRKALKENSKLTYYEAPQACFFDIGFNCSKGRFTNKKLRQAVAYAVDKKDLIAGAVNGMAKVSEAAIVTICPQAPKDFKGTEFNLEKAKQLMAEAGYADGLTVTMRVIGAANYTKPAEVLQAQLKKIGIDLKIETMERAAWFDKVYSGGDYEITYYAHPIVVADADFCTYPYFHSSQADGKGSNFYNYKNPELDKILEQARVAANETDRAALYKQVAEIVRDDAVCVPTYEGFRTMAASNDLVGVYADPFLMYYKFNYSWK
jgi:peptide/nickel transport system substrate-binding protein